MPELPAVEYSRRLLEKHVKGHKISKVIATEDNIIYQNVPAKEIEDVLVGKLIVDVLRHGKYLWLVLSGERYLLLHFGMTGFAEVQGADRLYYKSAPESDTGPKDKELMRWPPRFWKLQVEITTGCKFAFGDSRRLGRIKVLDKDPMTIPPCSKLGFDPILNMPPFNAEFIKMVKSRNVPLKSLLLDQSFAAGVGNWMADDIMLDARLHPECRTSDLGEDEIKKLHGSIKYISEEACAVNSDGSKFPSNWLFHCRWPSSKRSGVKPIVDGHKVEFIKAGGRATAFVPDLQKKGRTGKQKVEKVPEASSRAKRARGEKNK